jgi:hypothetical protein
MDEDNNNNDIKVFQFIETLKKVSKSKNTNINTNTKDIVPKEKQKRSISKTDKWETIMKNNNYEYGVNILETLLAEETNNDLSSISKLVRNEINKKISGYKNQDKEKNLYDIETFIDFSYIINRMIYSQLKCYYCKENMKIIYENIRDPKQWTVERIDNKYGHNKGNIEIACLICNLRRRTIYHERYILTKQLQNIKKIDNNK